MKGVPDVEFVADDALVAAVRSDGKELALHAPLGTQPEGKIVHDARLCIVERTARRTEGIGHHLTEADVERAAILFRLEALNGAVRIGLALIVDGKSLQLDTLAPAQGDGLKEAVKEQRDAIRNDARPLLPFKVHDP